MKNIIITGAAGFLGSHLMLHHLRQGDFVLGIDCFVSSSPDSEHVKLIEQLCKNNDSSLSREDICDPSCLYDCITNKNGKRIDLIYNFACPASPPIYQDMPLFTTSTCTTGVINVLDFAHEMGAKVVHASTSEVYGDPDRSPQREDYRGYVNSYGPRSCYDEGKRCAEALSYDYLNSYGVDVRLVRIFNTYGPHMDQYDGRVVSNFIRQALKNEPLTIYGQGQQKRSFCYVDDLIAGIVALGDLKENPKSPVNIGNPNEFTIKELASLVSSMIGTDKFKNEPMPIDDPTNRCPDITLAKNLLGWEPKVQIKEGLEKTISYFRQIVK
jgi:UDP-glucuronate decarboxylase